MSEPQAELEGMPASRWPLADVPPPAEPEPEARAIVAALDGRVIRITPRPDGALVLRIDGRGQPLVLDRHQARALAGVLMDLAYAEGR